MDELFLKIDQLIKLLDERKNASAIFFKNAKVNLENQENKIEVLNSLIKCYAITQYADFSKKEEDTLNEVINIARNIRDKA